MDRFHRSIPDISFTVSTILIHKYWPKKKNSSISLVSLGHFCKHIEKQVETEQREEPRRHKFVLLFEFCDRMLHLICFPGCFYWKLLVFKNPSCWNCNRDTWLRPGSQDIGLVGRKQKVSDLETRNWERANGKAYSPTGSSNTYSSMPVVKLYLNMDYFITAIISLSPVKKYYNTAVNNSVIVLQWHNVSLINLT